MKSCHLAIVGASGVVGQEVLSILEQRNTSINQLTLLASQKSEGELVTFKKESKKMEVLTPHSFKDVDVAIFSAGSSVSKEFSSYAVDAGTIVIDNTSYFRMDPNVPLIVPEINRHQLSKHQGIIANPNCSTAQLVIALKPIYDLVGINRVVVSSYQSVSGAGKLAMMELEEQSRLLLQGIHGECKEFSQPIAFNVIPQIDQFTDNGYTKEEMKICNETKKIFEDDSLSITATAVRVPVFIGHSLSVNVQTQKKITVSELKKALQKMDGCTVLDDPSNNEFPTPRHIAGKDDVFVGRIREDISIENGIEFWCVGDNLKKGAALNAIQILESLLIG